jgi:hypothetical protein
VLVEFDIANDSGTQVSSAIVDNQSLPADQVSSFSTTLSLPATLAPGQYTVTVAIFSPDHGTLYASSDTVGSFVLEAPPN